MLNIIIELNASQLSVLYTLKQILFFYLNKHVELDHCENDSRKNAAR